MIQWGTWFWRTSWRTNSCLRCRKMVSVFGYILTVKTCTHAPLSGQNCLWPWLIFFVNFHITNTQNSEIQYSASSKAQTNYSIMLKHVHPSVIVWIDDCGNVQVFCLELRSSRNNYHLKYTGKFQFSFKVQSCSCRIGQASPLQIFQLEEFIVTKLGIQVIGCYKLKVWYLIAFVADMQQLKGFIL